MALSCAKTACTTEAEPLQETSERRAAVFLDKDGTLLQDVPYNVNPDSMRFAPGAEQGLSLLGPLGLPLIVISNQPGVGLGRFTERDLGAVHARLRTMFQDCGATLGGFFWCPHAPRPNGRVACLCRKPMPGLLLQAAAEHELDTSASWMVGDIVDDVEAGRRAGCRTILIANGNETMWLPGPYRSPHYLVHDLHDAARVIAEKVQANAESGQPGPSRSRG